MNINKAFRAAVEDYKNGRPDRARDACRKILKTDRNNFAVLYFLGVISYELGDYDSSIEYVGKAVGLNPSRADAYYNLANAFRKKERFDEAVTAYGKAIGLNPGFFEAYYNLGIVHLDSKRLDDAIACFRKALELNPGFPDAFYSLGVALQEKGQLEEAILSYQKAIQLRPDDAEAYDNLGTAFHEKKDPEHAIACFQKAVQLAPGLVEAYNNLGIVLMEQGRHEESLSAYEAALTLRPGFIKARWAHCISQLRIIYPDEEAIHASRRRYREELLALRDAMPLVNAPDIGAAAEAVGMLQPFYLAYQGLNDRDLQRNYGELVCRIMSLRFPEFACTIQPPSDGERLRIGFVSRFFSRHSIWQLYGGWVKELDRKRFSLYGYYTGRPGETDLSAAKVNFTSFREEMFGFEQLCRTILADRLHVLIFPEIGMDPLTLRLAALRLAPVQCTSWMHPETTGLPTIDYYLSSDLMEPENAGEHYNEKLMRLPNLAVHYSPQDVTEAPISRESYGLAGRDIVYLCSQSLFKYLPRYDLIYAHIAHQVPGCRFLFVSNSSKSVTEEFRARISKSFHKLGLQADRHLVFLPRLSPEQFYHMNGMADIYLDNISWSGGITTLESIAFDLPVVTCPGPLMRGRHTAAMLRMMECTETIAPTPDDYVAVAVKLGTDAEYRRHISDRIRRSKDRIYADKSCIVALENFLERVVTEKRRKNGMYAGEDSHGEASA